MKIKYQHYIALEDRESLPRKTKKAILGLRMSKSALKRLIKSVKVGEPIITMYERPNITPYLFCPDCGCTDTYGSGNKSYYPEHWEEFRCLRCHSVTAYIDNSPYIHKLEYMNDLQYWPYN